MLSKAACGLLLLLLLLLLLGVLAVALAMNAFLRFALLALGAVPLLVTLLATNKTLVVLVPTVPLCFHPSGFGTLSSVVVVSGIALKLGSATGTDLASRCVALAGVQHRWPQSQLFPDVAGL